MEPRLPWRVTAFAEIARSVACISCGYELRGLRVDGRCPECGEAIARSCRPCPRCESGPLGAAVLREDRAGGADSLVCPQCRGRGFEASHLRAMLDRFSATPVTPSGGRMVHDFDAQAPVNCARCSHECRGIWVNHAVRIDRCGECGFIWIDRDEWAGVLSYVQRCTGGQPVPHRIELLLHDRDAIRREVVHAARTGGPLANPDLGIKETILAIVAAIFG